MKCQGVILTQFEHACTYFPFISSRLITSIIHFHLPQRKGFPGVKLNPPSLRALIFAPTIKSRSIDPQTHSQTTQTKHVGNRGRLALAAAVSLAAVERGLYDGGFTAGVADSNEYSTRDCDGMGG